MKYDKKRQLEYLFIQFQTKLKDYQAVYYAAEVITTNLEILFENKGLKTYNAVLGTLEKLKQLDYSEKEYRDWSLALLKKIDERHGHAKANQITQINAAYVAIYCILKKLESYFTLNFAKVIQDKSDDFKESYRNLVYDMLTFHLERIKEEVKITQSNVNASQAFLSNKQSTEAEFNPRLVESKRHIM